jgi:hypothetical protein
MIVRVARANPGVSVRGVKQIQDAPRDETMRVAALQEKATTLLRHASVIARQDRPMVNVNVAGASRLHIKESHRASHRCAWITITRQGCSVGGFAIRVIAG